MGGWSTPPSTGGGSIAPLVVGTNLVSQVNSTNAQTLRVYGSSDNTGVPTTNYSRLSATHLGGTSGAQIGTDNGGTGTAGDLFLYANGTGSTGLRLTSSGAYLFSDFGTTFLQFTNGFQIKAGSTTAMQWTGSDGLGTADVGIIRNATGVLEVNSGTAGTRRDLFARNVRTEATTVASLTAAATAGAGARSFVTDATAPTFGATVAGGGAVSCPVFSDGTNWKVG